MEAIKTTGLVKKYGSKRVVDNLNLCVPQGAIYGFIGRNGAGKSTTQKIVCGLTRPTEGSVSILCFRDIYNDHGFCTGLCRDEYQSAR